MALERELSKEFRSRFEAKLESMAKLGVKFYVGLSQASLYQDERFQEHKRKSARRQTTKQEQTKIEVKIQYPEWWRLALRFIVAYLCLKQLVLVILQYAYDILKVQSRRRYQAAAILRLANETYEQQEADSSSSMIEFQIAQYKSVLKYIGAPYIQISFIIECAQLFIILNTFAFYMVTSIYYRFIGPLNISLFRMLVDDEREQHNLNELILDEMNKLIESSRLSLIKSIEDDKCSSSVSADRCRRADNNFCAEGQRRHQLRTFDSISILLIENHNSLVRHLKRLALDGSLQSANRTYNWKARISCAYTSFYFGVLLFCSIGVIVLMTLGPGTMGYAIETNPMDLINLLELFTLSFINAYMIATWSTHLIFVLLDQCYAVRELRQTIDDCIITNTNKLDQLFEDFAITNKLSFVSSGGRDLQQELSKFRATMSSSNTESNQFFKSKPKARRSSVCPVLSSKSNSKLDSVLDGKRRSDNIELITKNHNDRNRLKRQLGDSSFIDQPLRHPLSFSAVLMIHFYVIYPLYALIHAPYLSRKSCLFITGVFWAFVFGYDCASLPFCIYHTQCKHLMKNLFRLISHIDEIRSLSSDKLFKYDSHIVTLLRHELAQPELATRKLSIMVLGHPFSYRHLIRIHFWTGLLSLYGLSLHESGTTGPSIVRKTRPSLLNSFI